jgi:hypothetical protein
MSGGAADERSLARDIRNALTAILQLPVLADSLPLPDSHPCRPAIQRMQAMLGDSWPAWGTALGWAFVHALGRVAGAAAGNAERSPQLSRSWLDEWSLTGIIAGTLRDLGLDEDATGQCVATVRVLTTHQRWFAVQGAPSERAYQVLSALLRDSEVQQLMNVNRYQGILWFRGESLDALLDWLLLVAVVDSTTAPLRPTEQIVPEIVERCAVIVRLQEAGRQSGYQIERLLEAAREAGASPGDSCTGS